MDREPYGVLGGFSTTLKWRCGNCANPRLRGETWGTRRGRMAGMSRRASPVARMIVDALIGMLFIMLGLGEFTARFHGWPSLINLSSVALCLLFTTGFFIDFTRTLKRL